MMIGTISLVIALSPVTWGLLGESNPTGEEKQFFGICKILSGPADPGSEDEDGDDDDTGCPWSSECGYCQADPESCEPSVWSGKQQSSSLVCEAKLSTAPTGCKPDGLHGSCEVGYCVLTDPYALHFECVGEISFEPDLYCDGDPTACGPGHVCLGDDCVELCTQGEIGTGPRICHYYAPLQIGVFLETCDPLYASGCDGSDQKCVPSSDDQGFVCVPTFDHPDAIWPTTVEVSDEPWSEFVACDINESCEPGSMCTGFVANGGCFNQCRWYCDPDEDECGDGQTCKRLDYVWEVQNGNLDVGVCVPEYW